MTNHFGRLAWVPAILLVASLSAWAQNPRSFRLGSSVTLNGKAIPAGRYTVSWESHSPEATVTFVSAGRVVLTAQGQWVDRNVTYREDAIVYNTKGDGLRSLVEIRFAGMKQALVFGESG